MPHDRPRGDLTGSWPGEIGHKVLLVADGLRRGDYSLSCGVLVDGLTHELDEIINRLHSLKNPDPLESEMTRSFRLLQNDLLRLREDEASFRPAADRVRAADNLQKYGERLYEYRFDSDPPRSLKGIADELCTLRELVKVYGPAHFLVTSHADWIASGISLLFHHDSCRLPTKTLRRSRDRALAAMILLDTIASREQSECVDFLTGAIDFFGKGHEKRGHHDLQSPPQLGDNIGRFGDRQRNSNAFVTSASGETRAKSLVEWAGGKRVTLAIVFTDVVGSTALGNEIGDECMNEILKAHFEQGRRLLAQYDGWEVKTIGDAFMAVFHSTDKALDFAVSLHSNSGHPRVRVRAGIHVGEVQVQDRDISGETVNCAKRVVDAAKGAEIWLSDQAKWNIETLRAEHHSHLKWDRHDGVKMKGFPDATLWSLASSAGPGLSLQSRQPS